MKYDVYAKGQGGWFITPSSKNLSEQQKDNEVTLLTNLGYTNNHIRVVTAGAPGPRLGSNRCNAITKLMQF